METPQPTRKGRHKRPSTGQVIQQLVLDTPAALISAISVNIVPPAVVHADDLTKNKLKGGSPNPILVDSCGLGKQAVCESTDTRNSLVVPALVGVAELARVGRIPMVQASLLCIWL